MLRYEFDVKGCALMIGLLSVCEVIGLHIYIALVDLDLYWEYGIIVHWCEVKLDFLQVEIAYCNMLIVLA